MVSSSNTSKISFSCYWGTKSRTTVLKTWKLQFIFNMLLSCFQAVEPFDSSPTMCGLHESKRAWECQELMCQYTVAALLLRPACQEELFSLIDTLRNFLFFQPMWMILNCCFLTTALDFWEQTEGAFIYMRPLSTSIFHFFQRHLLACFLNSFTLSKVSTGFYQLEVLYFKICIPVS